MVVTVRDLARVLPSLWQQEIRKGRTWTWPEFLSSVRDPKQRFGHRRRGVLAALRPGEDPRRLGCRGRTRADPRRRAPGPRCAVQHPARPLRAAPSASMRPCSVRGADRRSNPALGPTEVEALRRLNERTRRAAQRAPVHPRRGQGGHPRARSEDGFDPGADPARAPRLARRDVGHPRGQSPLRHVRRRSATSTTCCRRRQVRLSATRSRWTCAIATTRRWRRRCSTRSSAVSAAYADHWWRRPGP